MVIHHDPDAALTLSEARKLARSDPSGWCIVPLACELAIGRLEVGEELRIAMVHDDDGEALRFPSIPSARDFLKSELAVSRSMLLPLPGARAAA